jgi:hypothetical protein
MNVSCCWSVEGGDGGWLLLVFKNQPTGGKRACRSLVGVQPGAYHVCMVGMARTLMEWSGARSVDDSGAWESE